MSNQYFFAASSGAAGFVSNFGKIFDPTSFERIYIIKGGAGTGKSTFMKKIAADALAQNMNTVCYRCSSDPSSLDGVVIPELKAAIIDGTSPHQTEAKYPGACEILLDFGKALDQSKLRPSKKMIEELCASSTEHYGRAYALLRSAGDFAKEQTRVCACAYNREKADAYIERFLRSFDTGEETSALLYTFCRDGLVFLPTLSDIAEKTYIISGNEPLSSVMLSAIAAHARATEKSFTFVPDPIRPGFPKALWFGLSRVYIGVCDKRCDSATENAKQINANRFANAGIIRENRGYVRRLDALRTSAENAAAEQMKAASDAHSELERIYLAATDFSVIEKMLDSVKCDIFANKM